MEGETEILYGHRPVPTPPPKEKCPVREEGKLPEVVYLAAGKRVVPCDRIEGRLLAPVARTDLKGTI